MGRALVSLRRLVVIFAVWLVALMPSVSHAFSTSVNQNGSAPFGTCTLGYSLQTNGQANLRRGNINFFGGGGYAGGLGLWLNLSAFNPLDGNCGIPAADMLGYIADGNDTGNFSTEEYLGFSYCQNGNLYEYALKGLTNSTVVTGDQGASNECILPEIAVTSDVTSLNMGDTATLTFTLTQASDDFVVGDITVSNGSLSNFSGSGTVYTATFTPDANLNGTFQVAAVADNAFTNTATRDLPNRDGADTNNKVSLTIDTTPPPAPSITGSTQDGTTGLVTVTGTALPNAPVTVTFPDGSTKQVTADASGAFSAESDTVQTSGAVSATQTAPNGNTSDPGTATFTDSVAPQNPTIGNVTQAADDTVTVTGTAEPGSSVTVSFPDGSSVNVLADANGNYSATSAAAQAPSGTVTVTSQDAAGNAAASSATQNYAAPAPVIAIDSVTQNADGTLTVAGTSTPGSTVTITFPDGTTAGPITVPASGEFTATSTTVQTSGNVTVDGDNRGTTASKIQAFTDTTPPADPTVTGTQAQPDGTLTVTGTAEPGSSVVVTFPDGTTKTVTANSSGQYSATSDAPQGSGTVTVTSTDQAGNPASSSATANYMDTTAPAAPSISVAGNADGTMTATGNAEPGSQVAVDFGNGDVVTVTADASGNYSATSTKPSSASSTTVSATATDAAGNTGPAATGTYTDNDAPAAPVFNSITQGTDGKVTVSGTAEPGSTVTVTFGNPAETVTVIADPSGNFTATSTQVQGTGTVTGTATDAAGNASGQTSQSYTDQTAPAGPTVTNVTQAPDGTITVTATAEPGSTVEITMPDGTKVTATESPAGSGNFTATSTTPQQAGTVTATSEDAAGNVSQPTTAPFTDTTPPAAPTFNSVTQDPNTGTVTVAGTAEPGSTVEVTFPDGTTKTVVADASGNFSATSDASQPSGDVKATATDTSGNKSGEGTSSFADSVAAPFTAGTVTQNNDGTATVSGTGEPGATVSVTFPGGTSPETVTATVGPDGTYQVTSTQNQDSGTVSASMTDAAGNTAGPLTQALTDTVKPTPPNFTSVTQDPNSGFVTVTGTAEPNSTVNVTFPDGTTAQVTADPSGNFTVTSTTNQPSGSVSATATDAAGLTSDPVTQYLRDGATPASPTLITTEQQPDGTLKVTGSAEPGSTVVITYPDGTTSTVTAGPDGTFATQSATSQPSGSIQATAADAAGNTSQPTNVNFVDSVAPSAPVVTNITHNDPDGTMTVTGTSEPGTTVNVTFPDGTSKDVVVGPDGTYSVTSAGPQESGYVSVTATDPAGNTTAPVTQAVNDSVAPAAPVFDSIVHEPNGSLTVYGTAEPGATVRVTFPDGATKVVQADASGRFTATSAPNQPAGQLEATATDAAGNTSAKTSQSVSDGAAPDSPSVKSVVQNPDGTVTVSGTTEPGALVEVTFPNGTKVSVTADANGNFTLTSPDNQDSGTIKATATDAAGNKSGETLVEFTDRHAPAAPNASNTSATANVDGTITVAGTVEPNATVTVTWPDGTTSTVTADANGNYSVTSPTRQPSGEVSLTATDAAGNTSAPFTTDVVTDQIAPTVTVTGAPTSLKMGDEATLTFTFSEPVTGFELSDFVVSNGTAVSLVPVGTDGTTYRAVIRATGGGSLTIGLPANSVLDRAGNGNAAMTPIVIGDETVEDTQVAIAGFMLSRANNLLNHQPELIHFLRDRRNGHFNVRATRGQGTFSYASPSDRIIWSQLDGSWSTTSTAEQKYVFGVLGGHVVKSEDLLIGAMLQVDYQSEVQESGAKVSGTGWMFGPYFVAKHPDQDVYVEGRLLYGQSYNQVSPYGTYTDKFNTDRLLGKVRVSGKYRHDENTVLFPFLDASFTTDQQRAYTDSNGNLIPSQGIFLGRAEGGVKIDHAVSDELTVTGGISGIWSMTQTNGTPAKLAKSDFEGGRAAIEAGFTYQWAETTVLEGKLRYDGIGAENYESTSISLTLDHEF